MKDKANCGTEIFWHNCYKGTADLWHPDAYQHPAKMSIPLAFRIIAHLKELGLVSDSDTILDPMSGISTTGLVAGALGHKFIGVELEEKFIELSQKNKEYAERRLFKPLDWTMIKGDSRKLSELLQERGLKSIVSPPYQDAIKCGKDGIDDSKWTNKSERSKSEARTIAEGYSENPDNIGNLKDKPLKAITSPPYEQSITGGKSGIEWQEEWGKPSESRQPSQDISYGESKDNIGNLKDKPLKSVMSPPYEDALDSGSRHRSKDPQLEKLGGYSVGASSIGQIGNEKQESYLSAMSKVYREISFVSDVLCVVLKNPTRNGKLRRLDLDTLAILKDCGWRIHCQHRALLFEELEQADMFQGSKKQVKGRLSFFKRLSYIKGQPVASWEDVLVCVRE